MKRKANYTVNQLIHWKSKYILSRYKVTHKGYDCKDDPKPLKCDDLNPWFLVSALN